MGRVEALRAAIAHVEEGKPHSFAPFIDAMETGWSDAHAADRDGNLNAVARLEAPLLDRRWGYHTSYRRHATTGQQLWHVGWWPPSVNREATGARIMVEKPSEARARLLAVLRALLHEAEAE